MKTGKFGWGQKLVLVAASVPMVVFGILGGAGTYANITSVFHRSETALGVVAAGEGATFVLAMLMLSATMLGRPSPKMVRLGLWTLPMVAAIVCASTGSGWVEKAVFGVTPLGMVVSAEGLGYLARMIVIYRTGVDTEAQRRNAEIMQKIAFHNAQAQGHPDEGKRKASAEKAWKLAKKVGLGDSVLGANLVDVQRDRMTTGADNALVRMYGLSVPELSGGQDSADTPDSGQSEADSADTPDKPKRLSVPPRVPSTDRERHTDKLSVRKYILGMMLETPNMSKSDAWDFVLGEYGPDTKVDTFNKSWLRAKGDYDKIKAEQTA